MDASPEFLGGTSIYVLNFLRFLENHLKYEITCLFPSKELQIYNKGGVKFVGLKSKYFFPFNFINYTKKVANFLKQNEFDLINSHAMAGNYLRYLIPKNSFTTNTYHGVAYYFYKIHLKEKNLLKKLGAIYYMFFGYLLEKPPMKRVDKIISVSEHVEKELIDLYGKPRANEVIRSSVDTSTFKKRKKSKTLRELNLKRNKIHGLYVGRGGPWRKGLDRAIKISNKIYKLNKNYSLIVIGPTENKENKRIINSFEGDLRYISLSDRELISKYYSISDLFFCFSRYEGGAPILTLGEAMASEVIPICSKDSKQEIIKDNENGLIVNKFDSGDAKRIINVINDRKKRKRILENNTMKISEYSIKNWGKKYMEAIEL